MASARLLVVEDQSIIALDLKSRLIGLGYEVVATAAYGEAAVAEAGRLDPDLVLMDIRLKGEMDGIQAAERIRADYNRPVIYLTAHSDEQTLQRARLTEPYGYILKPFEDRELQMVIEIALYKHRMEAQVKAHERWLTATLTSLSEAVIATDRAGGIQFMNPAAEAATGWTQAEAAGLAVDHIVPLVDEAARTPVPSPVATVLQTGGVVAPAAYWLVSARAGSGAPIEASAAAIRDDRGRLTGGVLVFRDITQRRRVQVELQAERDFAQTVMAAMGQGLTVTDAAGRFEYINPAYAEFMGYQPADLLGRPPDDFTLPEDRAVLQAARAARQAGRTTTYETRLVHASGRLVDVLITGTPRWRGGQVGGAIAVVTDLTERKRAERRMAEEHGRLQALIAASRDGIVLFAATGQIQIINARVVDYLGLSQPAEAWLGSSVGRLLADLRGRAPAAARLLLAETRRVFQAPDIPGEGDCPVPPRALHWQTVPVRWGDLALGHVVTFHDVTAERNLAALREDLTHTLVHDLRRPLTGAQSALQVFALDSLEVLTADQRQMLGLADDSLRHLQELVDGILEVSRLEAGQVPLERAPVDLAALARSVVAAAEPVARQKQMRLTVDVPPDLPPAWADGRLVQRVLENLIGNALKFTPPEGVIQLSVRADPAAQQLLVTAADTGPGIPPELQGQLFKKFVTGRVAGHGSGLGLAFCRMAVEAHGGRIWAESGLGARFTFTLPRWLPAEPAQR